MTEMFCDYINGNDSSGDGSRTNPYKTINQASTGLTGSDEVKCAKSPADTALTGTLTWTHGSGTINTSADLRGEIAAKDLIRKTTLHANDYDIYWEVSSVTVNTIVIQGLFYGQTESNVASVKIGVTDTGAAATSTTYVQEVVASGTAYASKLKVSGGWDLSQNPAVQNGKTVFWQSGASRNGYGIVCYTKNYIELDYIHMARYNIGHYIYSCRQIYLEGCKNIRSNSYNISFASDNGCWAKNCFILGGAMNCSNTSMGIYLENLVFLQGSASHISADILEMVDCKILSTTPFNGYAMGTNVLAVNCDLSAIDWNYYKGSCGQRIINSKINSIICADTYPKEIAGSNTPCTVANRYNQTKNDHRIYFTQGVIKRNTANAKSGACMEWIPNDTDWPLRYGIWGISADESVGKTVKFWIKKSADFNGSCEAALFFNGVAVDGWDDMAATTSYVEKTFTCTGTPIVEDGVFEVQLKVKGTVGSIFLDEMTAV